MGRFASEQEGSEGYTAALTIQVPTGSAAHQEAGDEITATTSNNMNTNLPPLAGRLSV
jgi:hypothetical protein